MPQAPPSVADVFRDLGRAFRPIGLRWYVFGAQALVLHGLPRATADVDVTVLGGSTTTAELLAALTRSGLHLRIDDPEIIERGRVLPLLHAGTRMPVDVVLGGPGLEEAFAAGAELRRVGRLRVPVASATHLLVMKLIAARPKDLVDATALLRAKADQIDRGELESFLDAIRDGLGEDSARAELRTIEKTLRRRPRPKRA